jgi:hypothetical protein
MLSFLREQGREDLSANQQVTADRRADHKDSDNKQGQEYLTVAASNKSARKSTTLVAVLFAIGLVCLGFMIRKSAPKTAAAATTSEETKIETAIARLTGVSSEMFNRMDQIVKKFYEFSDVFQVQVNELVKNPFALEMFLSSLETEVDTPEKDVTVDAEMILQQQLRKQAKDLSLLSIMQSDRGNCCMINDTILYEGDSIRCFKVVEIDDSCVKLKWNPEPNSQPLAAPSQGLEIVLKLSE